MKLQQEEENLPEVEEEEMAEEEEQTEAELLVKEMLIPEAEELLEWEDKEEQHLWEKM